MWEDNSYLSIRVISLNMDWTSGSMVYWPTKILDVNETETFSSAWKVFKHVFLLAAKLMFTQPICLLSIGMEPNRTAMFTKRVYDNICHTSPLKWTWNTNWKLKVIRVWIWMVWLTLWLVGLTFIGVCLPGGAIKPLVE